MLKGSSLCLYSSNLGTFWLKIEQFWPFEEISIFSTLHPRWPPLLKIEISSNGQNCFILSQNMSKFELHKHNDELLTYIMGFFMNFQLFADFDRLCKLGINKQILKRTDPGTIPVGFGLIWFSGFRGEDLNVIFYQNMPNLHNRYKSEPLCQLQPNFGEMVLGWPPSKIMSGDPDFQPRWPKIAG
jgi:hypothetical protein